MNLPAPTANTDELVRSDGGAALLEKVVLGGDLSVLSPSERMHYYAAVCRSVGLNPLTRPFEYLSLRDDKGGDKLVLYARRDATDQLRASRGVTIIDVQREVIDDIAVVTVTAQDEAGRRDVAIGAVPLVTENGEWKQTSTGKRYFATDGSVSRLGPVARANAFMKAETKGKRRVTLSLCGLGMLDESEIEAVEIPLEPAPEMRTVQQPAPKVEHAGPGGASSPWGAIRAAWHTTGAVSEAQLRRLFAIAGKNGWTHDTIKAELVANLQCPPEQLPNRKPYDLVVKLFEAYKPGQIPKPATDPPPADPPKGSEPAREREAGED